MTNNKTGLEKFVEWTIFEEAKHTSKSVGLAMAINKAQSLLAEEKSAPIHADWKLREELGQYMDELKDGHGLDKDYADDLETILAKCPAVYFMEDRPTKPEAKQDDTAGLGCNICGSRKVYIRRRYPKESDRLICPCCLVEELEDIVSDFNNAAGQENK